MPERGVVEVARANHTVGAPVNGEQRTLADVNTCGVGTAFPVECPVAVQARATQIDLHMLKGVASASEREKCAGSREEARVVQ